MNTLTSTYILLVLCVGSLCEDRQMATCWKSSNNTVRVNQYGQLRGTTMFDARCSDVVRSRLQIMLRNADTDLAEKYWGRPCNKQQRICYWEVTNINIQPHANYSVEIAPSHCAICSAHGYSLTIDFAVNVVETTLPPSPTTIKRTPTSKKSFPEVVAGVGSAVLLAIILLVFVIRRQRRKRCNLEEERMVTQNNVTPVRNACFDIEMDDMSNNKHDVPFDTTEEYKERTRPKHKIRGEQSVIHSADSDSSLTEHLLDETGQTHPSVKKAASIFLASFPLPMANRNDEMNYVIKTFESKQLKISYLEKRDQNRNESVDRYLLHCNDVVLIVTDHLIDIWVDKKNVDNTALCDLDVFYMLNQMKHLRRTLHVVDFTTTEKHKKKLYWKLKNIGIHTLYDILSRNGDFELLLAQLQKETKC